ncbi:MAG TPA: hypothetical protein VH370_15340 [Humisphaera sp.]|jgi:hypothetical protein|nr:hypothetical protein [Humisphaera sp.]
MNRSTRGQWELYRSHRQQIERLIVPSRPGGRACVLGAGNCNDLDLRWMSQVFGEVHLVDLDTQAVAAGVERQKMADWRGLQVHAPIDLTGIADLAGPWADTKPADAPIEMALAQIRSHDIATKWAGDARFDLVLSPCVLSQLIVSVRDAIGARHPRYKELRNALRARHLRMMFDLLNPGGKAVLLADLASTENFPEMAQVPEERLDDLMRTLIADGKCFAALVPADLRQSIEDDQAIRRGIENVQFTGPWLWHLGLSKTFLVYAMTFVTSCGPRQSSPRRA